MENHMTIFGKPLSEYISFAAPFLILVPVVGLIRLGLSLQGMPNHTVRWVSMTVIAFIGIAYFAIRVHTSGFGSYKQLLVLVTLQNLASQVISILGILISAISGMPNIFSAPEFSFGGGNPWLHLAAHLVIGTTVGSLFPWAIGSLILFITRKIAGPVPAGART
jgi:hypothetical protein